MGFSERTSNAIGGANDYGAWMYNLEYKTLWPLQTDIDYKYNPLTLRNTVFIWNDVIEKANAKYFVCQGGSVE